MSKKTSVPRAVNHRGREQKKKEAEHRQKVDLSVGLLKAWMQSLDAEHRDNLWEWLDSNPDAIHTQIDWLVDMTAQFDLGNSVVCDGCCKDFTGDPVSGGLLFGSWAMCPECTPGIEAGAKKYGETQFITARCPAEKSFADWVVQDLRKGDNTVKFYSLE